MRVEHSRYHEIHHLPLPSGKGYMRVRLLWRYDPPQLEISELACGAEVSDLLGIGQALIDLHRQLRHPEGIQPAADGKNPGAASVEAEILESLAEFTDALKRDVVR